MSMHGDPGLLAWWGLMCFITILNIGLWCYTYTVYKKRLPGYSELLQQTRFWLLLLSAIYVVGCGFRSVLPREDLRRVVMFDSWISSVAIGRSVATIAELCFAAQWAIIVYEIGKSTGQRYLLQVSRLIVPLLVLAECFSWYACTTTNYLGSTIEESLWGFTALLTTSCFIVARPYYRNAQRKFLNFAIFCGLVYVAYMIFVDVPAYAGQWMADKAAGKNYLSLKDGFTEVATVWRESRKDADWQYEKVWMTLYFSVAVWGSMLFVNIPAMDKVAKR